MIGVNEQRVISAAIDNADRERGTIGKQDEKFKDWIWKEYQIRVTPCVKLIPGGTLFDRFNAWGYWSHKNDELLVQFLLRYRGKA